MATSTQSHAPNLTGDADFRTWIQHIQAGLLACGLTQTADTGQIDSATVARPAGTNTAAGYEIWRFNDTLHGTAPLFFKIEYGTGGTTARPSIWATVGSGSDGAGNLTGQVGTRKQAAVGSNNASVAASLFNYDATLGLFAMVLHSDLGDNRCQFIVIERARDENGDPDAAFAWSIIGSSTNSFQQQAIPASGSVPAAYSGTPPAPLVTASPGTPKSVHPIFPDHDGLRHPILSLISTRFTDYAAANTIDVDRYGSARTYRVFTGFSSSGEGAILWSGAAANGEAITREPWAAASGGGGGAAVPTTGQTWPRS